MKTILMGLVLTFAALNASAEGGGTEAPFLGADYSSSYEEQCREGSRERILETTHQAGEAITTPVDYVCRSGKWTRVYGKNEARPTVTQCRAGQTAIVLETSHDAGEAITTPVHFTCKNGRWVR